MRSVFFRSLFFFTIILNALTFSSYSQDENTPITETQEAQQLQSETKPIKNLSENIKGSKEMRTVPVWFLVVFLMCGAIFFTLWYRFINIRMFSHSIEVIKGKYDNPEDKGEISHFKALTSALSATVGLGNIAGVAVAIQLGGPGAVFWMTFAAIFGMTAKFSSCALAQYYRKENVDGSISGGPMYYIDLGFKEKGKTWGFFGKVLAVLFAIFLMGGALGGGNMFQANQSYAAVYDTFLKDETNYVTPLPKEDQSVETAQEGPTLLQRINGAFFSVLLGDVAFGKVQIEKVDRPKHSKGAAKVPNDVELKRKQRFSLIFGLVLAGLVGLVIIGGVKRIGAATSKIVPIMCGMYIIASLYIIISNISGVPQAFALILKMAFTENAAYGGTIGVIMWGLRRAAFSNEAGLGSASIMHAAAKTKEPIREGIVAMIGPFIDTIVICNMTALVVILTGAWDNPAIPDKAGVELTTFAFKSAISWFPVVLSICVVLFAYSSMISWCYYGERGWIYLVDHFGNNSGVKTVMVFRLIFVGFVVLGTVSHLSDVLDFSDALLLSMAFPNIIGGIVLAPKILEKTKDYVKRYKAGEFKTYS
ncbi:MAG: alanine:cation symporter family protein [Lentisphaerales bacterium]|nr:alanine:cation symporter family protein [Lentisphaerales bacterium]